MPVVPAVGELQFCFGHIARFQYLSHLQLNRFWAHSLISGFQPPLIIAFIVGNWAYTVIIRPQPPFNRWLEF